MALLDIFGQAVANKQPTLPYYYAEKRAAEEHALKQQAEMFKLSQIQQKAQELNDWKITLAREQKAIEELRAAGNEPEADRRERMLRNTAASVDPQMAGMMSRPREWSDPSQPVGLTYEKYGVDKAVGLAKDMLKMRTDAAIKAAQGGQPGEVTIGKTQLSTNDWLVSNVESEYVGPAQVAMNQSVNRMRIIDKNNNVSTDQNWATTAYENIMKMSREGGEEPKSAEGDSMLGFTYNKSPLDLEKYKYYSEALTGQYQALVGVRGSLTPELKEKYRNQWENYWTKEFNIPVPAFLR